MNVQDLTGVRFTRLTVIKRVENNKKGNAMWLCLCDCGKEKIVLGNYLRSGNTKSCGCYRAEKTRESRFIDFTGKRFGRLVVKERGKNKGKATMWTCICDCGNTTSVAAARLIGGITKSCGCIQKEVTANRSYKHGGSYSKLVSVWQGMLGRCYDSKNREYHRYGGRGIAVCDEWKDYGNFYKWALEHGYNEQSIRGVCTIDRVNNDGWYSPYNCKFSNTKEQSNNRRSNRILEYNGEVHTLSEWSEIIGIRQGTLGRRVNALGWSIERALTTPLCNS